MEQPTADHGHAGKESDGSAAVIQVRMLGTFQVTVAGHDLASRPGKPLQLFKCLLSQPRRRISRDMLAEWLWPDSAPDAVDVTIRTGAHALRRILRQAGLPPEIELLTLNRDGLSLAPGAPVWIDADEFERLIEQAASAPNPLPFLEAADALYRGGYLPDDAYEEWAEGRRRVLERAWVSLQLRLAQERDRLGDLDGAAAPLQRLLESDPCDERAGQALVRVLLRQERRADAARVYQRLTDALRTDLQTEPSEATAALGREIQAPGRVTSTHGTILATFLLTDIEGSVPHWEHDADAMQRALIRHDALLDEYVQRHAGHVVQQQGEGDSCFAVFPRANDAVAAACDLQRAFMRETWPTRSPLRVRMALHTGEAIERGGHYYGSAVNRCARLRGLAHGGQVLLSEATTALVRDSLPSGAGLQDLAQHLLRGLEQPEHVYQLTHPDIPADFPPLTGTYRHGHNLPTPPTPLIGRDDEVQYLSDLLQRDDVRLVALTGAGGVGKTRLGLRVASNLVDHFAGAVCFVPLGLVNDPALVTSSIVDALGLREIDGRLIQETLEGYLKEKRFLLLLDNFEQLLPAASLVAELLASCPRLKVLVTSRAALHVRGERDFVVQPLACPAPLRPLPVESLSQYAAVSLFVQRATAVQGDFDLTEGNASVVAEICRRVDGLPLGIELAATRVKLLPPRDMLARMERRLPFLTGGPRDLPERQRTLRSTIVWSYDLLGEGDQLMFRRLAVFEGGCTLDAAEAVCDANGDLSTSVLDALAALLEQSLVRRHESANGEPRYTMLETIREFALEQLEASGEAEEIRDRHAAYFLRLAEAAEPELWGYRQVEVLAWFGQDQDNLHAALEWLERRGETIVALRLAGALGRFWEMRGHLHEGRRRLDRVLTLDTTPSGARARALNAAAALAVVHGDTATAQSLAEQSHALAVLLDDVRQKSVALTNLGIAAYYLGDHPRATERLEESLALMRTLDDLPGTALALAFLGNVAHVQGDGLRARRFHDESLALRRRLGDRRGVALSLHALAAVSRAEGNLGEATELLRESLTLCRAVDEPMGLAMALSTLGNIALQAGDTADAARLQRESLAVRKDLADRRGIAWCLVGLAGVALAQGQTEQAAQLLGAAQGLRERAGAPLGTVSRNLTRGAAAEARAQLGAAVFDAAWEVGRAMTMEEAIACALEITELPG